MSASADMEKLQHLKSCLRGPALVAVGALEVTHANYLRLRALHNMGTTVEISECILIYCLLQKVDCETQLLWEDAAPTKRLPKCNEFVKFLDTRCQKVENIELTMLNSAASCKT